MDDGMVYFNPDVKHDWMTGIYDLEGINRVPAFRWRWIFIDGNPEFLYWYLTLANHNNKIT